MIRSGHSTPLLQGGYSGSDNDGKKTKNDMKLRARLSLCGATAARRRLGQKPQSWRRPAAVPALLVGLMRTGSEQTVIATPEERALGGYGESKSTTFGAHPDGMVWA